MRLPWGVAPGETLPYQIAAKDHERQRPDFPEPNMDDVELFGLEPHADDRKEQPRERAAAVLACSIFRTPMATSARGQNRR